VALFPGCQVVDEERELQGSSSQPGRPSSGSTGGARSFQELLKGLQPQVEETLDRLLPAADESPSRLHSAMRYSVFAGGKRIRPVLAVLGGELLGARRHRLLAPAAALELIHTFSLVHDDLPALDDDDLRRGRPTVHLQYDEATAILAGDALLTLGLATLASHPPEAADRVRSRAVELVAEAVGSRGMIGGQVDDLEAERRWPEAPAAALEAIHRRKTGALLGASLQLGALHAGATPDQELLFRELGARVGMMFQIADDILDVEGTSGSLGKTAGKDAAARKLTYPGLYGVAESRRRLEALRDESARLAAALPDNALVLSLLDFLTHRRS
jgi:geranylgeranyl pyrophosphate synthase